MDNARRFAVQLGETSNAAGVMELVDVPDSKSGARDGVGVRVPPPAPHKLKRQVFLPLCFFWDIA